MSKETQPDPNIPNQRETTEHQRQAFFWALHGRTAEEFPGLDATLDKYGLIPENFEGEVSEARLKEFLGEASHRGLIQKRRGLSLREYIGALFSR